MPAKKAAPKTGKLDAYRAKRSAERTPEPFAPAAAAPPSEIARPRLFVVQKHAARRLHYDFRLELGGTLRSWAVPKDFSTDPAEKRLAVEVEDHPIEYADFEGVIPAGNYGAGAVIVWDRGVWIPSEDPEEGLAKGKLSFELRGYKLRGLWHLFKTKSKGRNAEGSGKEWLLVKKPDAHSGPLGARALTPESIYSGLTIEELKQGGSRTEEVRAELERLKAPRKPVAVDRVGLMLAETAEKPFSDPRWIFELKYDGFRLLVGKEEAGPRLLFRRGYDATATFPEVARAVAALPAPLVLDAEVVVLDDEGRPSFNGLQKRALLQRSADIQRAALERPATLYAFDLLGFEDFDLRPLPLVERKRLLRRLLPQAGPLRYADHVEAAGEAFLEEVRARNLEGIMAKRSDAPYRSGRSSLWRKLRLERTGDFVIVGMSAPQGTRTAFGALHLAAYKDGVLTWVGKAGSGFTEVELTEIKTLLEPLRRKTPPFANPAHVERGCVWVEPRIVCEVRYMDWTVDALLRQPVFLRLRDDKPPEECTLEGAAPHEPPPAPPPVKDTAGERRVAFSNLDKVFWPEEGYTKGDLIEYYRTVSPWLLRFLADRPVVLTRYPDGITGKNFYQKDAPGFVPGWVRTERMWSEHSQREIDYFVCDDLETLLYLVNLGTIPLHVWSSRAKTLQTPDWCILDLDPKEAPFAHVVEIARAVRALCDEMGLPAFPKTSGATGLHVLIPLGRQMTYDQSRTLAELMARVICTRLPEIATVVRLPSARGGKVYVDFLQNRHGQLLVAPFSVRPRPSATVSTPLEWSEVKDGLDPRAFTIRTMLERLKAQKTDPMGGVLELAPDLGAALARLSERVPPER